MLGTVVLEVAAEAGEARDEMSFALLADEAGIVVTADEELSLGWQDAPL